MINNEIHSYQNLIHFENLEKDPRNLLIGARTGLFPCERYLHTYNKYLKEREYEVLWESLSLDDLDELDDLPDEGYPVQVITDESVENPDEILKTFFEEELREVGCKIQDGGSKKIIHKSIKVIARYPSERIIFLEELPQGKTIHIKNFDIKIMRELRAVRALINEPRAHHLPLLRLTQDSSKVKWPEVKRIRTVSWKVLTREDISGIGLQRSMVKKALGTPDYAILEGPPGSGKTTVITEIILQMLSRGMRVILVGSTHIAVDNVLEKIIKGHLDIAVPIRVATEGRYLPEEIRKYTYENMLKSKKNEIIRKLEKLGRKRTPAQERWFRELQGKAADHLIHNILMESVNLVCGTTIGVLQFHDIRERIREGRYDPLFDCMILDEASKTTFTEFLVPALFAQKWIISGDPKQLSPYIEREMIKENIKSTLIQSLEENPDENKKVDYDTAERICLGAFRVIENRSRDMRIQENRRDSRHISPAVFLPYSEEESRLASLAKEHLMKLNKDIVVYTGTEKIKLKPAELGLRYQGSDVIIDRMETLRENSHYLPPGCYPWDNKVGITPLLLRQNEHYKKNLGIGPDDFHWEQDWRKSLSSELAWRLIRHYELKKNEEQKTRLEEQLQTLTPHWGEIDRRILYDLMEMRRIAFPSVIESLLEGIERNDPTISTALTDGFPEDVKESRWIMLEHQHRMHPEISRYPRELVYIDENRNPTGLKDGEEIAREWSYSRYGRRVDWISPERGMEEGKTFNRREIETVLEELEQFKKWARNIRSDSKSGIWEIAILSFYEGQTRRLVGRLRGVYNRKYGHIFHDKANNVRIFAGNVDSMQGREADIVFLSLVRTRRVGFLDNPNRINVAITRARYQLVIIGDHRFFLRLNRRRGDLIIGQLACLIAGSKDIRYKSDFVKLDADVKPLERFDRKIADELIAVNNEIKKMQRMQQDWREQNNAAKKLIERWHDGDTEIDIHEAHESRKVCQSEMEKIYKELNILFDKKRELTSKLRRGRN